MSVIKFNPRSDSERWDSIPRKTLQDTQLSSTAFQLLMFLLSQSSSWQVSNAHLQKQFKWGKNKVASAIKELKDAGYLEAEQSREKGKFGSIEYIVHPVRQPLPENSDTVNRAAVDAPLENTELEKTEEEIIPKSLKSENQLSIAKPKQELTQNPELGSFEVALAQYSALAEKYGLRIPRVVSAANEAKARKTIKTLEVIGVDWVEYLRIIARSPHLLGKNNRNWKATFDWIINPTNVEKIVNGNYEQDRPAGPPTEDEKWQRRMIGLRDKGLWLDSWGDKPGVDGCQVPPHILAHFGWDMAVLT